MAEKSFGVKEINLIGASGTPTIESPNNLNLNAVNVAISTNVSIGGTLSVTGNVSVGGTLTYEDVTNIDSVGIITARSEIRAGAGLTVVGVSTFNNDVHLGLYGSGNPKVNFDDSSDLLWLKKQTAGGSSTKLWIGNGTSFDNLQLQQTYTGGGQSEITTTHSNILIACNTSGKNITVQSSNDLTLANGVYPFIKGEKNSGSNQSVTLYYGQTGSTPYANPKLETTNTGVSVTGTLAATAVTGDGSGLTNLPAATPSTSDIQVVYEITNQTSNSYFRFAGNGVDSSANNPDLFLERGKKYRFINNSGGSHPFQIQTTGGSAYTTGLTYPSGNSASSGNIDFAVRWDAPSQLKYQCTSHGSMQGNIYMTGGVGRWIQQPIVTLQSGSSHEFTGIPADVNEVLIIFDGLSFASASNEIEFVLGNSGGYVTSGYIISASFEPGGSYTKRTTSIRFIGIGAASYTPTGRVHLWKPVHSANWWVEGLCFPWATEGEYQHRVAGTANSGGMLSKIKIQGSGGANFDNSGNGKIQLSYLRY